MKAFNAIPAVALALLLCACDAEGGGSTATLAPTVTVTVTPSPVCSSEPADLQYPDLTNLFVSTEGILPLTIGLPPETNPGRAMIAFVRDFCYDASMGITTGNLDRWLPNYTIQPFYLSATATSIQRIDIHAGYSGIGTAEGIRIGSTQDELLATYPDLTAGTNNDIHSSVYWLTGTRGYLVFETQDPDHFDMSVDTGPEAVILIRVIEIGIDPDFGAANSGNIAGACF